MTGRVTCALALPLVVAALAGCGGGSSSGSSSNPSSANYDPAHTTLKAAGLEVCGQAQQQASGGLERSSSVTNVRAFFVAPDCMGAKTSPNEVTVYQFKDRQSLDAGVQKIKTAYPKGAVTTYGAVVILATGPDATKNLVAIKKALPQGN
jgi:hypothetical protein